MKKEENAQKIKRIEEPEINRLIVLRFLEKLEKMTNEERRTIIKTIQILNNPVFITQYPPNKINL